MSLNIQQWLTERNINLAQQSSSAQLAGIAFRLLQDMELKSLTVFDICIVAEILELPLLSAYQLANTLIPVLTWLLRIISRKQPLKRTEGTWLSFQIAYISAWQHILTQELQLKRPWLYRSGFVPEMLWSEFESNNDIDLKLYSFPINDNKLQALVKTLRPGRLTDTQAEQALSMLADSLLGQQFNQVLYAWLLANGAEEMETKLIVQRLGYGLISFLIPVVADHPLALAQLQKFVRLCNLTAVNEQFVADDFNQHYTLDIERENYRSQLIKFLSEPLFMEYFSIKDVYVPLRAEPSQKLPTQGIKNFLEQSTASAIQEVEESVDLMSYILEQLQNPEKITVIYGESGSGKTTFCQMLSAHIAMKIYPQWMPILINLSDMTIGDSLEESLMSAFPLGKFTTADSWLSSDHPPCLFILDGLDQLPYSTASQRYINQFVEQLIRFQTRNDLGKKNKIILTMKPDTPLGLSKASYSLVPTPVEKLGLWSKITIKPLYKDEFRLWFQQWTKLQSKSIAQGYFSFLKQGGVFRKTTENKYITNLISKPLFLYWLGILYRDGFIDEKIFHYQEIELEYNLYNLLCQWLLGLPSPQLGLGIDIVAEGLAHARRSPEAIANFMGGFSPETLLINMQNYALNILHKDQLHLPNFAEQLLDSQYLPQMFFNTRNREKVRINHYSIGEYLAAEAIAREIELIAHQQKNNYGESIFVLNSPLKVAEHLYQLLSYDVFSSHIKELIMGIMKRKNQKNSHTFSLKILFDRLYEFYQNYCLGRWFDSGVLQKISQQKCPNNPLYNSLQTDAIVGLNVFLLLCAIAQTIDIPFFPCGNPQTPYNFDPNRFLIFLNRLTSLDPNAFWLRCCQGRYQQLIYGSLSKIQLPFASLNYLMLSEVNLWKSNLSSAELIGINLSKANLQEANLSRANLTNANLTNVNFSAANLEGANLSGANLTSANFTLANLKNACVAEAQMDESTRNLAKEKGAFFSLAEFKNYCEAIRSKRSDLIPEGFEFDTNGDVLLIETAEGKPIILNDFHLDYENVSTVFNQTPRSVNDSTDEYEGLDTPETVALENYWYDTANHPL